jgi:hypothetical protein
LALTRFRDHLHGGGSGDDRAEHDTDRNTEGRR